MSFSKQDLILIDSKFEGLTKLMNAHFENVNDNQEQIIKRQDIANHRTTKLEIKVNERDLFCGKVQVIKEERDKHKKWRVVIMTVVSAVLASLILNFGILEFFKLVK